MLSLTNRSLRSLLSASATRRKGVMDQTSTFATSKRPFSNPGQRQGLSYVRQGDEEPTARSLSKTRPNPSPPPTRPPPTAILSSPRSWQRSLSPVQRKTSMSLSRSACSSTRSAAGSMGRRLLIRQRKDWPPPSYLSVFSHGY